MKKVYLFAVVVLAGAFVFSACSPKKDKEKKPLMPVNDTTGNKPDAVLPDDNRRNAAGKPDSTRQGQ